MSEPRHYLIVVAGGRGTRMGAAIKKQYLQIDHIPILTHTLNAFQTSDIAEPIMLVCPEADHEYCMDVVLKPYGLENKVVLAKGGGSRQDSVYNGLTDLKKRFRPSERDLVLIHDGVRPFVDQDLIFTCLRNAREHGACIPAVPVKDTIKSIQEETWVEKTLPRQALCCAQTPQVFEFQKIWDAFLSARKQEFLGTDDASLIENVNGRVKIVTGSELNIKITTPEDLFLAKFIFEQKSEKT